MPPRARTALLVAAGANEERVSALRSLVAEGAPSATPSLQLTRDQRRCDAALDLATDGGAGAAAFDERADLLGGCSGRTAAPTAPSAAQQQAAAREQRRHCDALADMDDALLLWTLRPQTASGTSRRSARRAAWWQQPSHRAAALLSCCGCVAVLGMLAVVGAFLVARFWHHAPGGEMGPALSTTTVQASLTMAGYSHEDIQEDEKASFIGGLSAFFNESTQTFIFLSCVNANASLSSRVHEGRHLLLEANRLLVFFSISEDDGVAVEALAAYTAASTQQDLFEATLQGAMQDAGLTDIRELAIIGLFDISPPPSARRPPLLVRRSAHARVLQL
jgi:hypothetical protein